MSEQSYTRQLTTILSVDAVGYSKLTGVSEELALERLVERRGIITEQCEKAGGRMFGVAFPLHSLAIRSDVSPVIAAGP